MLFLMKITMIISFVIISLSMSFPRSVLCQRTGGIDGVYRLVSEATTLRKPKMKTIYRKPPDWLGLFFFQDGYFSVDLMDQSREIDWFTRFPKNIKEIGFESFAGKYESSDATLILRPDLKLHPFYDRRIRTFEVKFDGDILTLTEEIRPYTEDMREGERITILSKIKSGSNNPD